MYFRESDGLIFTGFGVKMRFSMSKFILICFLILSLESGQVIAASLPPVAAFTATPSSGVAPLTVHFTDQSLNNPTTWIWYFGEGDAGSIVQNPVYTFNNPGTYDVTLAVLNTAGNNRITKQVVVTASQQAPVAAFTATPSSGVAPLTVHFTDQSLNNPTTWVWYFGEGDAGSIVQNPVYTFNNPGTYDVTLAVVNNAGNNRITKQVVVTQQSPSSEEYCFVTKWGSPGWDDGQFYYPAGIAVDNYGAVYVVNSGFTHESIQKFDNNGNFIMKWGSSGSGNGEFNNTLGIAINGLNEVYTTECGNNRVQKFDSSGTFLTKWGSYGSKDGEFNEPVDIAVDKEGMVYIVEKDNHRVQKFDSSGTFLKKWGVYGSNDGEFQYPRGIAVDKEGNVYVVDWFNYRIQKFTSEGTFLTKWGSYGLGDGQFNEPTGIEVDSDGNVYVANWGSSNSRVQKFDSYGNFITKWGSSGSGEGQFDYPWGIAVDSEGNVFVSEYNNQRVQKFSKGESVDQKLTITSLNPSTLPSGSDAFILEVRGTNFVDGAKVLWDGNDRSTVYVSNMILGATILKADVANSGTYSVKVVNPDGKVSNEIIFEVILTGPSGLLEPPVLKSPGGPVLDPDAPIDTLTPRFTWDEVPGADEYGLYISKEPYGEENIVFDNTALGIHITKTPYTIDSGYLEPGLNYRWNMNSHSSAGWNDDVDSGYSSRLYFTTPSGTQPEEGPVITKSLTLSPGPYYIGDTISATFAIKNNGQNPVSFESLTIGGRYAQSPSGDGKLPFGWGYPNFVPYASFSLAPGKEYVYQGDLLLKAKGNYHFFCTYSPYSGDLSGWNCNIPVETAGIIHEVNINVENRPITKTPIVLVHGLNGKPSDWDKLTQELRKNDIPVWIFDYNGKTHDGVIPNAIRLQDFIDTQRSQNNYDGEIDIICHSMGAQVSRYYMEKLHTDNKIRQWMGIGPATHGSAIADEQNPFYDFGVYQVAGFARNDLQTNNNLGLSDDVTQRDTLYHVLTGINYNEHYSFLCGVPTTRVKYQQDGQTYYSDTYIGDGAVAGEQSRLSGASFEWFFDINHFDLPSNPVVISRILQYYNDPSDQDFTRLPTEIFVHKISNDCYLFDANMLNLKAKEKINSIEWDFDDGESASGSLVVKHTYNENSGTRHVSLKIILSDKVIDISREIYLEQKQTGGEKYKGITIIADCPVDLQIQDSKGRTLDKLTNGIPNSSYIEYGGEVSNWTADIAIIMYPSGIYNIIVIPDPLANSDDSYSLFLMEDKENSSYSYITIANNTLIDQIPTKPYKVEISSPLTATFSAFPLLGNSPLNVNFIDESLYMHANNLWSFGDGTFAENVTEVTHTYTYSGNYTVTLTVTGPDGEDTASQVIQVLPPQCTFFGNATLYGNPAQIGTVVTTSALGYNTTFITTILGQYGETEIGKGLVLTGDIPNGTPLTFTIGGLPARCGIVNEDGTTWSDSYPFSANSRIHLDLDVPATINADFSGTPTTGYPPLQVMFTDNSTGDSFERVWDFGDGSTSKTNLNEINHTYTIPGTYTVSLEAMRASATDTEVKTGFIMVIDRPLPPVADFTASPLKGIVPLKVTFTDLSTGDPDSYLWNFGDGSKSSGQNPVHTYSTQGIYSVTLTAENDGGNNSVQKSKYITVEGPVKALPGLRKLPRDLNGDGRYEDLDGNGKLNANDVILLARHLQWIQRNEPGSAFDFNNDGKFDFRDFYALSLYVVNSRR